MTRSLTTLVIDQKDVDELAQLLEDQPYRYAVVALRWISTKIERQIERQIELNRETDEEIARLLRELDEDSGGRDRRFTFFDCMQTRRPDEPLN